MYTAQKMKFLVSKMVTFTQEILNGKLHFLCSGITESISQITGDPMKNKDPEKPMSVRPSPYFL